MSTMSKTFKEVYIYFPKIFQWILDNEIRHRLRDEAKIAHGIRDASKFFHGIRHWYHPIGGPLTRCEKFKRTLKIFLLSFTITMHNIVVHFYTKSTKNKLIST